MRGHGVQTPRKRYNAQVGVAHLREVTVLSLWSTRDFRGRFGTINTRVWSVAIPPSPDQLLKPSQNA